MTISTYSKGRFEMAKSSAGKGGSSKGSHGKDVTVGPNKNGPGWSVKKDGNDRASNIAPTKKEAVDIGRDYARKENSELIIKGENGRIQSKDSHGHDPKSSKG